MAVCEPVSAPDPAPMSRLDMALRLARQAPVTAAWSTERTEVLARLWAEGVSYTLIGRRLNVSKSAAIGRARRIGLPARGENAGIALARRVERGLALAPVSRVKRPAPPAPARPKGRQEPPELQAARALAPTEPDMARLGAHQCRWPIGEPGAAGFGFCGRLRPRGAAYCAAHAALAVDAAGTVRARARARSDRKALMGLLAWGDAA